VQTVRQGGPLVETVCRAIYPRGTSPLPRFDLPDTVKLWQSSCFYVSNVTD